MRSFIIGLVCGAIVAAIATAIAFEIGAEAPPPPPRPAPPTTANVAPVESRPSVDLAELARRLEGANDRALADALGAAEFDRSWAEVNAVGQILRTRAQPRVEDPAAISSRARSVPLPALEAEVNRRRLVLDLKTRDNPATRLLDHAADDDSVTKLVDMFSAEPRPADYERVREDAALVLAFGATDRGREVLARSIHEGPASRAEMAARALGQSEDERAFAVLTDMLGSDREPEVRRLAAKGLGTSSALAHGDHDAVVSLALAARSDQEPRVRLAALEALGGADLARAPLARAAIGDLLSSPGELPAIRTQAIASLRAYRDRTKSAPPDLVKTLLDALSTEHDSPIRRDIAVALGDCAPPSMLPDLETALASAQDPAVREALAKAIADVKARGEPPP